MMKFERMIPFILFWEVGYKTKPGEAPEAAYRCASRKGFHAIPGDKGGQTMCGVTLSTYSDYCRGKGHPSPGAAELRGMPYTQWRDILKSMFWDRCKADLIADVWVAMALVDWVWISGSGIIKRVQRLIGVTADGIIGAKTLQAINLRNPEDLFTAIQKLRREYMEAIVRQNQTQKKFLRGWLNRIRSMEYGRFNFNVI